MEASVWAPRRQGNAGELSAITWLTEAGALVSKPLFEASDYDLVADFFDGRLLRVQVKTSTCWFIPASELGGSSGILLGGPKYATYEIEPGVRLQSRSEATQ